MSFRKSLLLVFTVFVFCESAFVDSLGKCKLNDGACERDRFQSIIRDIAKTGIPELGIPQLDPFEMNNVSLSILNVIDFTLVKGTVKGVKDCIFTKFDTNVEDERAFVELVCDFTIKGHYKVFSDSPAVKTLIGGGAITGDGNGKVNIEKLHLKLDFAFFIQKRNGENYIKPKNDKIKYSYDIKGKMTFFADKLFIGQQESSKLVTGLLNENWKVLMSSFGKPFMDKATNFLYEFLHKFFDTVPAKYFISDDLSPYARDA